MEWGIIIGYGVSLAIITVFSLEQLYLALIYRKLPKRSQPSQLEQYPQVTVQLPIYNEKYVAKRLLDTICLLDYPLDRLEIQVLDDSTDETQEIIATEVKKWQQKGLDIEQVQREVRTGFKAGALQHGLERAKGEFIAIFDADFLPAPDFLLDTLPHFSSNTGMVQTRWGHVNERFSLLTQMQAFGLNAHFTIEQTGRNASGKFMNFNGTAGVWRKTCITDAGGWQHDTLTEDLDLSYRAQLKGWKFEYLEDVICPAELPILVPAIKSQQYRWNKGAAETARKNARNILTAKATPSIKLHAMLHLLNSSVFLFLLLGSVLSVPLLYIKSSRPELAVFFNSSSVFLIGFVGMMIFYWIAAKAASKQFSIKSYVHQFPLFLTFSMGLSLHNAIAVVEGYLGIKSPFIRTPKFNIVGKSGSWKNNSYIDQKVSGITLLEGLLALYFLFGFALGIYLDDFGLVLFHLMLTIGFGAVCILSINPMSLHAQRE